MTVPRRLASLAILALASTGISPDFARGVNGTPVWNFSPVASAAANMSITSPSLAFDHYGVPSVAWAQTHAFDSSCILTRSRASGLGGWQHQTIDSGANAAYATSLSFDRAERPTVVWVGGSSIKTLYNDATLQTVANNAGGSRYAVQAYHDLTGTLRGAYTGNTPGNIFTLSGTNGVHSSQLVASISNTNSINDLTMTTDSAGRRHIAARASLSTGTDAVIVTSEPFVGGSWPVSTIATADAVNGISLATDPIDGRVAMAYTTYDGTTSKLFYAKSNGFSLVTTEVQSSTSAVFEDIDLKFDLSDGQPAIAFERQVPSPFAQQLWFAYLNASQTWQTSLIDGTIQMNHPTGLTRRPSLAFDDFGTSWPAVAYVDADGSLKVAVDPPVPAPEPSTMAIMLFSTALLFMRKRRPVTR